MSYLTQILAVVILTIRRLIVLLHYKQFVCNSYRLGLVQNAPGILGITRHGFAKATPEIFWLLGASGTRRSGKIGNTATNGLGAVTTGLKFGLAFVHRVRTFRTEEAQRIVAEHIGVGQDLVISQVLLMLINRKIGITSQGCVGFRAPCYGTVKHPFKLKGVVI